MKTESRRLTRPVRGGNNNPRTPDKWLAWSTCLVSIFLLMSLTFVVGWLATKYVPGLLASPDPTKGVAAVVTVGIFLLFLVTKILGHLRLTALEHMNLSRDFESDRLGQQLIEAFAQKHPPDTSEELNALLGEVHQLESHRHERASQYYQNIDNGDGKLWSRLLDLIFRRNS
jgi:hypothetical protein